MIDELLEKGCTYLLKNDPVFKHYYNPNHQLKTIKINLTFYLNLFV